MNETEMRSLLAAVRRMSRRYRRTPLGADDAEGVGNLAVVEAERVYHGDDLVGFALERARWRMTDAHRSRCGRGRMMGRETLIGELDELQLTTRDDYFVTDFLRGLRPAVARICVLIAYGYTRREIAAADGVSPSRISQLLAEARPSSR